MEKTSDFPREILFDGSKAKFAFQYRRKLFQSTNHINKESVFFFLVDKQEQYWSYIICDIVRYIYMALMITFFFFFAIKVF